MSILPSHHRTPGNSEKALIRWQGLAPQPILWTDRTLHRHVVYPFKSYEVSSILTGAGIRPSTVALSVSDGGHIMAASPKVALDAAYRAKGEP